MILENYQKMIQRKNEIDILQKQITDEVIGFFKENDLKVNNIRLYTNSIIIYTNYSRIGLDLLKKLEEKYESPIDVEIHYESLAIIITLQQ